MLSHAKLKDRPHDFLFDMFKYSAMDKNLLQERLHAHVRMLASEIGERNVFRPHALEAAARYITEEWQSQGYSVTPQCYPVQGVNCANIEVSRMGRSRPEQILLVGAHYDSVRGSPGANDNGSGVAALLEIARFFTEVEHPEITVRFVAFVNEEPPFFMWQHMGSLVYARAARKRSDRIQLMISLEMLGYYSSKPGSQLYPPLFRFFYPDRAEFIAFVSNLRSRRLMHRAVQVFRTHSDFPLEHTTSVALVRGVAASDHFSFWRQGYPAFMVTDTAYYRYPYYHTAFDTPDKLCYQPFASLTYGLCQTFNSLASGALD